MRATYATCSSSSADSASCCRARTWRPSPRSRARSNRRTRARRAHSQRVQSYATALARAVGEAAIVRDPSTPYGFLLHDVGKIGIPDGILRKPGPLSAAERRRMQTHTVLGEAMLSGVAFLKGEGIEDRPLASRALGRPRLSRRPRRRRDPARRAHLRRRGRAGRDDEPPPVPPRHELEGRAHRDPRPAQAPVRSGCRGRLHGGRGRSEGHPPGARSRLTYASRRWIST